MLGRSTLVLETILPCGGGQDRAGRADCLAANEAPPPDAQVQRGVTMAPRCCPSCPAASSQPGLSEHFLLTARSGGVRAVEASPHPFVRGGLC